jgi:hypothetical protein
MMLSPRIAQCQQIPLIHEVYSDDKRLLNTLDGECFDILYHFRWEDYREPAADYYNALYDFNQAPPQTATAGGDASLETQEEARQRLLFDRATAPIAANPAAPILFQAEVAERRAQAVQRWDVAPGAVPLRLVGCKPKCFFGLLKGFIGASLMGLPAEPEQVHLLLRSHPAFARVCGFSHKEKDRSDYHYPQIPSLRKPGQFDQIMTEAGIWDRIKLSEVKTNLATGVIRPWPGDSRPWIGMPKMQKLINN